MLDNTKTSDNAAVETQEIAVPRLLGISIGIRLVFDTGIQLFNPFLPLIASGLNISEVSLGTLVGLRNLTGLISPVFGALGDRRGYRLVMCIGLLAAGIGAIMVATSRSWFALVLAMIVWGCGMSAFTPSLHAYLSARLPYAQRARGIGVLEYSWALAGIVGLYFVGYLIAWQGWQAPFFVLGVLLLAASAVVRFLFSPAERANALKGEGAAHAAPLNERTPSISARLRRFLDLGENRRSAYANMLGSTLLFFGAVQLMITHGLWLRTEYGLDAVQLGTVALLLGLSDLCASVSVSLFVDRLGKRASVMLGATGALLGYILLPFLNISVYLAVGGLALARSTFEFGIVSNISLLSEQSPEQRGKVFTLAGALNLLGGAVAGASGPWIYQASGVGGLAFISGAVTLVCLIIFWGWVRDAERD